MKCVISPTYKWRYIGVISYNPLILTFDPNLLGHPSTPPPRMSMANKGLGWDSLLKMLHNSGGDDCILGGGG